jgi:hypothetical protein
LNYSILQGELEHEAALEDMHMFFVAFNKRQKKIVEMAEAIELHKDPNHNSDILLKEADTANTEMNVINLEEEVDME